MDATRYAAAQWSRGKRDDSRPSTVAAWIAIAVLAGIGPSISVAWLAFSETEGAIGPGMAEVGDDEAPQMQSRAELHTSTASKREQTAQHQSAIRHSPRTPVRAMAAPEGLPDESPSPSAEEESPAEWDERAKRADLNQRRFGERAELFDKEWNSGLADPEEASVLAQRLESTLTDQADSLTKREFRCTRSVCEMVVDAEASVGRTLATLGPTLLELPDDRAFDSVPVEQKVDPDSHSEDGASQKKSRLRFLFERDSKEQSSLVDAESPSGHELQTTKAR